MARGGFVSSFPSLLCAEGLLTTAYRESGASCEKLARPGRSTSLAANGGGLAAGGPWVGRRCDRSEIGTCVVARCDVLPQLRPAKGQRRTAHVCVLALPYRDHSEGGTRSTARAMRLRRRIRCRNGRLH